VHGFAPHSLPATHRKVLTCDPNELVAQVDRTANK
jgi:hypothetical protein